MFKQSLAPLYLAVVASLALSPLAVCAQSTTDKVNDFFGASVPNQQLQSPSSSSSSSSSSAGASPTNGSPSASPSSGLIPAPTSNGAQPADYTADEKRVQKKQKAMVKHVQSLIDEGDRMMKEGQAKKDDKLYKKGKIKKEIGERNQAEMKANAAQADAAKHADKADGT